MLGRMFWGTVYNLGVLFNNIEHTIGALMNVNRCRDVDVIYRLGLGLGLLLGGLLGRRETILFLERAFVSFIKDTKVSIDIPLLAW